MDDILIPGRDDDRDMVKRFTAQYDAPAYVRRARGVEEALERVVLVCQRRRDEWLVMVRIQLGTLKALAGDWDTLRPWLAGEDQKLMLQQLDSTLKPRLRVPIRPTSAPRVLRRALRNLAVSIERFNQRWARFLPTVDLTEVNRRREEYNRFYLLEKECAVRSARVARQGYAPLAPLTLEDLMGLMPFLPMPRTVA